MDSEFKSHLQLLSFTLDQIQLYVDNNAIKNFDSQKIFYEVQMKFESLSESINYKFNYNDYHTAIKMVKELGYVSFDRISRALNLRVNQVVKMVEEMEIQGIVSKPIKGLHRYIK